MSTISASIKGSSDVSLWLKIKAGESYSLADMPSIIPLRWAYIRNNWELIKGNIKSKYKDSTDQDSLNNQLLDFTKLVDTQRNTKINPLSDSTVFYRYHLIFENIMIESIPLTNEENKILNDEINRINRFSKNDFIDIKSNIVSYRDKFCDIYGISDETYNESFNRNSATPQNTATINELNYINSLQQTIKTIDFILANLYTVDMAIDPFALARTNANNPDINIGQYSSGRLVRLNYGETLQSLSKRYLNDADKWLDIAIANGLKPPYIDEVGERVPIISNGSNNYVNISRIDSFGNQNIDKFYINQFILLKSSTQTNPDQRSIVNIKQIPISGEIILELDGEDNLSLYRVDEDAHVRVYAKNTINSSQYILIPSQEPITNDRKEVIPWFLNKSAEDEKRAKIDFAISEDGDLILSNSNDVKLSYGLDNAIQAIKLKLMTELGTLPRHPNFGLINIVGSRNDGMDDVKNALISSINQQIINDNRFDRVENIFIDYIRGADNDPNSTAFIGISLSVRLAGGTQVIPISFTVNNL